MAEPSESGSSLASLIPEFYYDLIARVIPGGLILWLYKAPEIIPSSDFAMVSVGVAVSYFLGLTVDAATDLLFHLIYVAVRPAIHWCAFLRVDDDGTLWTWSRTRPAAEQVPLKKMFAEKILFRIASAVAFMSIFFPPPLLLGLPHRTLISIAATGLSIFCMFTMYKWMGFIKNDPSNQRMTGPVPLAAAGKTTDSVPGAEPPHDA